MGQPIYMRQNSAVKPMIPGQLTKEMAANLFTMKHLETRITMAEYNRWLDVMTGSVYHINHENHAMGDFYIEMVRKYLPQYYHIQLLIFLYELNEKRKI